MLSQWEVKNRNILKTDRDISLKFGMYLLHGCTKPTLDKLFDSMQYSRWYCTIKVEKLKSLGRNSLNVIQTRRKKWMATAYPHSWQQFYVLRFSIFFLQCCKKWKLNFAHLSFFVWGIKQKTGYIEMCTEHFFTRKWSLLFRNVGAVTGIKPESYPLFDCFVGSRECR